MVMQFYFLGITVNLAASYELNNYALSFFIINK